MSTPSPADVEKGQDATRRVQQRIVQAFGRPLPAATGLARELERRWRAEQRAKTVKVIDLPEDDSWVAWL